MHATTSENVQGVTVGQDLTWQAHYWGETWRESGNQSGVVPDLLKHIGLLRYLARVTSKQKLKSLIPGMFTSKILYCLQLTGSVFGLSILDEHELMKLSCPKSILLKLQSCQRQALAMMIPESKLTWETRISEIWKLTNNLSVHQLIVYRIIMIDADFHR